MRNYKQPGKVMEYSNSGAAISSGDVVVIGARVGIALTDIAATTGKGSVQMEGVYEVAKKSGDTFVQGALVYWDADPGEATSTSTDNTLMGYAFEAAGSAATTMLVKINA